MEKSKAEAAREIVAAFNGAIKEAETVELKRYVVAFQSDGTPMKVNALGEIKLLGQSIWSSAFSNDAQHVADELNKQLAANGGEARCIVERSSAWRVRRVEQLNRLIEHVRQMAEPTSGGQRVKAPKRAEPKAKPMPMLTLNERKALRVAFKSARGNGHDFGFVGDIVKGMRPMKAQAVGAIVTSLQQKGFIRVHEPVVTNDGGPGNTYVQFTWEKPVADINALVN